MKMTPKNYRQAAIGLCRQFKPRSSIAALCEDMKTNDQRALNAWIAEHVMGFVWARDTAKRRSDNPPHSKFKKGTRCLVPKSSISRHLGWAKAKGTELLAPAWDYDVPNYASPQGTFNSDGASPLDVLERCIRYAGCEVEIKRTNDGPIRIKCGPMRNSIIAIHDEFPMAICLFAKQLFSRGVV